MEEGRDDSLLSEFACHGDEVSLDACPSSYKEK